MPPKRKHQGSPSSRKGLKEQNSIDNTPSDEVFEEYDFSLSHDEVIKRCKKMSLKRFTDETSIKVMVLNYCKMKVDPAVKVDMPRVIKELYLSFKENPTQRRFENLRIKSKFVRPVVIESEKQKAASNAHHKDPIIAKRPRPERKKSHNSGKYITADSDSGHGTVATSTDSIDHAANANVEKSFEIADNPPREDQHQNEHFVPSEPVAGPSKSLGEYRKAIKKSVKPIENSDTSLTETTPGDEVFEEYDFSLSHDEVIKRCKTMSLKRFIDETSIEVMVLNYCKKKVDPAKKVDMPRVLKELYLSFKENPTQRRFENLRIKSKFVRPVVMDSKKRKAASSAHHKDPIIAKRPRPERKKLDNSGKHITGDSESGQGTVATSTDLIDHAANADVEKSVEIADNPTRDNTPSDEVFEEYDFSLSHEEVIKRCQKMSLKRFTDETSIEVMVLNYCKQKVDPAVKVDMPRVIKELYLSFKENPTQRRFQNLRIKSKFVRPVVMDSKKRKVASSAHHKDPIIEKRPRTNGRKQSHDSSESIVGRRSTDMINTSLFSRPAAVTKSTNKNKENEDLIDHMPSDNSRKNASLRLTDFARRIDLIRRDSNASSLSSSSMDSIVTVIASQTHSQNDTATLFQQSIQEYTSEREIPKSALNIEIQQSNTIASPVPSTEEKISEKEDDAEITVSDRKSNVCEVETTVDPPDIPSPPFSPIIRTFFQEDGSIDQADMRPPQCSNNLLADRVQQGDCDLSCSCISNTQDRASQNMHKDQSISQHSTFVSLDPNPFVDALKVVANANLDRQTPFEESHSKDVEHSIRDEISMTPPSSMPTNSQLLSFDLSYVCGVNLSPPCSINENNQQAEEIVATETRPAERTDVQVCLQPDQQMIMFRPVECRHFLNVNFIELKRLCKQSIFTLGQHSNDLTATFSSHRGCIPNMELAGNCIRMLFDFSNRDWQRFLELLQTIECFDYTSDSAEPLTSSIPARVLYYLLKTLPKYNQIAIKRANILSPHHVVCERYRYSKPMVLLSHAVSPSIRNNMQQIQQCSLDTQNLVEQREENSTQTNVSQINCIDQTENSCVEMDEANHVSIESEQSNDVSIVVKTEQEEYSQYDDSVEFIPNQEEQTIVLDTAEPNTENLFAEFFNPTGGGLDEEDMELSSDVVHLPSADIDSSVHPTERLDENLIEDDSINSCPSDIVNFEMPAVSADIDTINPFVPGCADIDSSVQPTLRLDENLIEDDSINPCSFGIVNVDLPAVSADTDIINPCSSDTINLRKPPVSVDIEDKRPTIFKLIVSTIQLTIIYKSISNPPYMMLTRFELHTSNDEIRLIKYCSRIPFRQKTKNLSATIAISLEQGNSFLDIREENFRFLFSFRSAYWLDVIEHFERRRENTISVPPFRLNRYSLLDDILKILPTMNYASLKACQGGNCINIKYRKPLVSLSEALSFLQSYIAVSWTLAIRPRMYRASF